MIDLRPIKDAGLTVMVDPMGQRRSYFPKLIGGGRRGDRDPQRAQPVVPRDEAPQPIPPNVDAGLQAAVENHADVLLITDGDADRCGIGDENGDFINQLRVYALLAYYLLEIRGERGPIVKTLSTTTMLNRLGEMYGVPVYETGVGFKYVAPKMTETNALIGGEESGGYAFRGNVPERDGILAGLYMLDFMVRTGKKPTELLQMLFDKLGGEYFYDRVDRPFSGDRADREKLIRDAKPENIGGLKVRELVTVDGFQFKLEDGGWLLIRLSGTEPIMRIYCETTHGDR
jgi:phosphomannomutase